MNAAERAPLGVLLMAYGTPQGPDEVEPYFRHIRGGRAPSAAAVEGLQRRYAALGGKTPLLEISRQVAGLLEHRLAATAAQVRVYLGMKHWHPFIADVVATMAADGIEHVVAVPLAPHYSRISIGGYRAALDEALGRLERPMTASFVERWHDEPLFLEMMATLVRSGLSKFTPERPGAIHVVFSAHSLPERIRTWDDPYESELLASSGAVAKQAGVREWSFAWQSAGETGEPWLGPDIREHLTVLRDRGVQKVLQVPIGFVCDHLEILWDIDIEARDKAAELDLEFRRTELPNTRADFIRTLATVVRKAAPPAPVVTAR